MTGVKRSEVVCLQCRGARPRAPPASRRRVWAESRDAAQVHQEGEAAEVAARDGPEDLRRPRRAAPAAGVPASGWRRRSVELGGQQRLGLASRKLLPLLHELDWDLGREGCLCVALPVTDDGHPGHLAEIEGGDEFVHVLVVSPVEPQLTWPHCEVVCLHVLDDILANPHGDLCHLLPRDKADARPVPRLRTLFGLGANHRFVLHHTLSLPQQVLDGHNPEK